MDTTINFKRQVMLFDPAQFESAVVSIVGLGNIGSNAAVALARLGIKNFILWDDDTVEAHNLASQSFDAADCGVTKVQAVRKRILAINPQALVQWHESRFTRLDREDQDELAVMPDILIIGVDSMEARKEICGGSRPVDMPKLLLDARIGGNQLEVYNIHALEEWSGTLSDNPDHEPCGGKYISYVSMMVGGLIANQVKKFLRGEKMDSNIVVDVNTMQVVKNVTWK